MDESKTVDDLSHKSDSDHDIPDQPQNILHPEKPTSNHNRTDIIVFPGCVACSDTSKLRTLHKCTKEGCENLFHSNYSVDKNEYICTKLQIPTTAPTPNTPPPTDTLTTE
jgi:hypothetical protein